MQAPEDFGALAAHHVYVNLMRITPSSRLPPVSRCCRPRQRRVT